MITAFVPLIGYDKAEELILSFQDSLETDFRDFLCRELGAEMVNEQLQPSRLMALGYRVKR